MANKMTMAQVKETAKREVLDMLRPVLNDNEAVCFGSDFDNCILCNVDGQEVWVSITLTAKQYTKTRVADVFDPYEVKVAYDDAQRIKAQAKAERDAKRAAKVAKSKGE